MTFHKPPPGFVRAFPNLGDTWADPPKPKRASALPHIRASFLAGKAAPPRKFIVPGLIPDRTVTLFTGDGGVGKSTLIEQLAVSVSIGVLWIGLQVERGPVVFLSAEDDTDELHRRLEAIAEAYGTDIAGFDNLHLVPLAGLDAVLGAPEKSGLIRETSLFRNLRELVDDVEPRLVILDTLADVFAGNEIVRTEARQFIGLLRGLAIESDLAVVVLAHPSLSGIASGSGTSGNTGWNNSVRSRLYFDRLVDGNGHRDLTSDLRVLRTMKANYGATGGEIRLRYSNGVFVPDADGRSSADLMVEALAERAFLDLLRKFAGQGRDVSAKPGHSYAPAIFEKHPDAAGIRKRDFVTAMERLLGLGRIKVETVGPPSRRVSRLIAVEDAINV